MRRVASWTSANNSPTPLLVVQKKHSRRWSSYCSYLSHGSLIYCADIIINVVHGLTSVGQDLIFLYTKFRLKKLRVTSHSEDLGVDRKIILECILVKQGEKLWTRYI
jgi:hypothetical protein